MITFQETLTPPPTNNQPLKQAVNPTPKPSLKIAPPPVQNNSNPFMQGVGNVIKYGIDHLPIVQTAKIASTIGNKFDPTFDQHPGGKLLKGDVIGAVKQIPSEFQKANNEYVKDTKNIFSKDPNIAKPAIQKQILAVAGGLTGGSEIGSNLVQDVAKTAGKKVLTPAEKVFQAVKEAVPINAEQKALRSVELAKRTEAVNAAAELGGEAAHAAQKKALSGSLPSLDFTAIKDKVTPEEIGALKDQIQQHPGLTSLDKVATKDALDKLVSGQLPQQAELRNLTTVFGKQVTDAISKHTGMQGVIDKVSNVLNVPRALNSSIDLSASGRQGIFAIPSHPIAAAKAFGDQFKAAFSEGGYQNLMRRIQSSPTYQVAKDAGVAFTDTSGVLSGKEESYMSNLAGKIPVIGKLVRASDRGYSGFLNSFRHQLFEGFYKNAEALGKAGDQKYLHDMAGLVNNMTGRGDLGALNRYAPVLNGAFFSPRLIASRVQLMNPVYYAKLDPTVRKEAVKSLVAFVGTGLGILGAAKAAGLDVGVNPTSSDFGKIRVGNTRYDIWGGFQQYAVLLARILKQETTSSTSGKVTKFGVGYKPENTVTATQRFLRGKLAPIPGLVYDYASGSDALGKPFNLKDEAYNRLSPFFIQDFNDAVKENGLPVGALLSVPGFFGVGGNTYNGENTRKTTSTKSKPRIGTVLR